MRAVLTRMDLWSDSAGRLVVVGGVAIWRLKVGLPLSLLCLLLAVSSSVLSLSFPSLISLPLSLSPSLLLSLEREGGREGGREIMSGNAPPSVTRFFPINSSREQTKINIPRPRIDLFKSSLIYSVASLWNSLPLAIKSRSNYSFKKHYLSYLTSIS